MKQPRQWPWYVLQIAIVMGVVWWVTITMERPDLVQFSVILGVVAATVVTAITIRLRFGRGAIKKVDDVDGGAFRLLRPNRHPRDGTKLVDGSRVREDRR